MIHSIILVVFLCVHVIIIVIIDKVTKRHNGRTTHTVRTTTVCSRLEKRGMETNNIIIALIMIMIMIMIVTNTKNIIWFMLRTFCIGSKFVIFNFVKVSVSVKVSNAATKHTLSAVCSSLIVHRHTVGMLCDNNSLTCSCLGLVQFDDLCLQITL